MQLDGQVSYDLQRLTDRFGQSLDLKMAGTSQQPFSFRGPLRTSSSAQRYVSTSPDETVQTSLVTEAVAASKLGWDSARIHGFEIGPGELDLQLREGVMSFAPVDVTVSGGRVAITPELDLRQEPMLLHIPAGLVAERVHISPEMCHRWLKYVAPLVADATAVEGELSVTLEDSTIPLSSPTAGRIRGLLDVHSVQIGPGGLTQQLLLLADQVKDLMERRPLTSQPRTRQQWVRLPAQQVVFHVQDNRVYHDGLQLVADDVVIQTSGSVGLDQSLSMMATVPIQDEWIGSDRWLSALKGQTIQVPVGGTLSNPRLDSRAIDQLAKQFLSGAATRLLEQEVGRGLERLLGPRDR